MYLKDNAVISIMKNSIMFLRICFLFPSSEELKNPGRNVFIKFTVMFLVSSYFPIGIILNLIKNIKTGENYQMDEDLMKLLTYFGVTYFTFQYFFKIRKLAIICKKLSDFETFGKPKDFDQFNKFFNKFSVVYYIYHMTSISIICFSNVITIAKCKEKSERLAINEICGMLGTMLLPFEYDYFPVKQIVFIYQLFATFLIHHNAGIISFVIMESTQHVKLRFRHLCQTFIEVLRIPEPFDRRRQFNNTVQYHYSLIELGDMINNCYNKSCMVHLILTAPVFGATAYRLATAAPPDAVCTIITWVISTWLACSTGQRLQDTSTTLGDILYQTEWYNLEAPLQRDLILVMLRANRPIVLRAGPFGSMSYETIVMIVKTSYSYLALLQQTM